MLVNEKANWGLASNWPFCLPALKYYEEADKTLTGLFRLRRVDF
ncbi:MAG: hypothetical protein RI973_1806 [Bacteroidota bacterium]|jgi:hypothetical protein